MAGRALFVALAAPLLLCNAWQAPLLAGRAPLLRQAGMGAMSPARQGAGLRLAGRPSLARSLLAQDTSLETATVKEGVLEDKFWMWKGYKIRYQSAGEENTDGPSLVLIHGFGGNADHWRKNTPELAAQGFRVFAVDLLGYGYSDKPLPQEMGGANGESSRDLDSYLRFAPPDAPRYGQIGDTPFTDMAHPVESGYNFYTWADQVSDFTKEIVGAKSFLICNSIGSSCGLQVAVDFPEQVSGVQILNPSLRQLNIKRQTPFSVPFVSALQTVLRETPLGEQFFSVVATENTVRTVFQTIYPRKEAVTDELVQCILKPGRTLNAPKVFLDFISYSAGPLPEEQLSILSSTEYKDAGKSVPVSILWGEKDPWEDVTLGRYYERYETVEEFVPLPGLGHCPMDEAPEIVNPKIAAFVRRHA